jgi:hypothetical protein
MSNKLSVFVSSVQKELEDERLIVQNLLNTDAFLSAHCTPVLYEFEPASPGKALEGCLESLDGCQVYLLIVGAAPVSAWFTTPPTEICKAWSTWA